MAQGILISVLTVLGSGIVAALVSSSLNEGRERWELRRSKIEEMFKDLARFVQRLHSLYLLNYRYFQGSLGRENLVELMKAYTGETEDFRHLEMNFFMYSPDLIELYGKLYLARSQLNKKLFICEKQRETQPRARVEAIAEFDRAWDTFGEACDEFKKAIILNGRNIAHEQSQVARMIYRGAEQAKPIVSRAFDLVLRLKE